MLASTLLASVVTGPGAGASGPASLGQARKDLLVLADMPAGWTSTKNPNTGNNTLGDTQLAHCIGVPLAVIEENPPSVNSRQFQNGQGTLTVADNVTVFPSAKNAVTEDAVAKNAKYPPCLTSLASGPLKTKLFGKSPKGTSMGTPLVSAVAPFAVGSGVAGSAQNVAGIALSVPITAHGQTINVTITQLFTVKGRLGHQVTFTAIGESFPLVQEQQIMAVAAGRL
jgi:hypothetical protein